MEALLGHYHRHLIKMAGLATEQQSFSINKINICSSLDSSADRQAPKIHILQTMTEG